MKGSDLPKKSFLSSLLAQNCRVALSCVEHRGVWGEYSRRNNHIHVYDNSARDAFCSRQTCSQCLCVNCAMIHQSVGRLQHFCSGIWLCFLELHFGLFEHFLLGRLCVQFMLWLEAIFGNHMPVKWLMVNGLHLNSAFPAPPWHPKALYETLTFINQWVPPPCKAPHTPLDGLSVLPKDTTKGGSGI